MAITNWEFLTVAFILFRSFFFFCTPQKKNLAPQFFSLQNHTHTHHFCKCEHPDNSHRYVCHTVCSVYCGTCASALYFVFFFIANCCSFVFASSTLYRIIKCCVWFYDTFSNSQRIRKFLSVFFSVFDTYMSVFACGLDKSVRLQFNSNVDFLLLLLICFGFI